MTLLYLYMVVPADMQVSIPERRLSCFSADVATMHQKSSCEVFNENDGTTV